MAFDENLKKILENEINESIHGLPSSMTMAQQDVLKKIFGITTDWDFAIGFALSQIIKRMELEIFQKYQRRLTDDENDEMVDCIWRKRKEFQKVFDKWKK